MVHRIVRHLHQLRRLALGLCVAGAASLAVAQGAAPATYNVGATATGVPFTFLDVKTNTIQGMMVDTVTAVGKAGGFGVNVQQTVFSALIPSLTARKIDIVSAAMLKTAARQEVVDFSDPVYSYGEGLIVKGDDARAYVSLDELKGEVVGAQVGTVFLDMLTKKGIFKEVRSYDSVADMTRDLSLGRIKAGLGDQPIIAYQLRQNTFPGVKLVESYKPVNVGDVCLVVRKGDTETMARLNKAIAAIKADGTLAKIVQKWGI
ncbi:ABC transporter substrate-binding protein [Variovorax sp. LT1R20]|uniref:ABC transporter substrate-binding protein n=1 Tax=Variovorax sp. LT1R20 TaxID=3443729 RepID=UPI003F4472FB